MRHRPPSLDPTRTADRAARLGAAALALLGLLVALWLPLPADAAAAASAPRTPGSAAQTAQTVETVETVVSWY